ncbi:D-isomer specific 2-hydroxyacid dehydrogenase, NAD-binding protein [Nitrosomonas eutropha C91]|uniref:D-isomer specific 2-hydroxyacid dehydrogenase, NAD-binding protein n=2 Tax=Nitrosomonas eutropha TaxID=916 RepID=Q0AGH8_NITEC|nr:D-isomer specific 2-hydroxyacid dehydrogenase, NAD-binding protein [Nitrosomonas eutropha C91]
MPMKITFFSTQPYDRESFLKHQADSRLELIFMEEKLTEYTVSLARGSEIVCVFVNDTLNENIIRQLSQLNIQLIALRCAGFNNVDLKAAQACNIKVVRVPAYSPHAVAEHTLAMIMTLNRKTHKAYNRVREQNFSLNGLLGFDLYKKTVGVIGTGHIGEVFCRILHGLGCNILACDPIKKPTVEAMGIPYVPMSELFPQCDILSLHCPLNEETRYLINNETIAQMKAGIMLINTSRGGLIDTKAVITGLKTGKISYLGIDVYEQEADLFFQNLSEQILHDDTIARLMTFPNVLITAHQGFFTQEALSQIALTTLDNVRQFIDGEVLINAVSKDNG